MSEINLLQKQSTLATVRTEGQRWLFRFVTGALVLVILAYAYISLMSWRGGKQIDQIKEDIKSAQQDMTNNKSRSELVTRQGQLKTVNQLLSNHKYWSTILPELARATLSSSNYTSIDLDKNGALDITVSTPSYEEAEKYLQIFDLPEYNKYFSNVRLVSLGKSLEDNVTNTTMRLNLTVNPDLVKK